MTSIRIRTIPPADVDVDGVTTPVIDLGDGAGRIAVLREHVGHGPPDPVTRDLLLEQLSVCTKSKGSPFAAVFLLPDGFSLECYEVTAEGTRVHP